MLERPVEISDDDLIACLRAEFALTPTAITFLPLGADQHTAVYRASVDQTDYFVKLRLGDFDAHSVIVPHRLHEQGIRAIIAPIPTRSGGLWADLKTSRVMVYPFVAGVNGFQQPLSPARWADLGRALRQLHTADIPLDSADRLRRETFAPDWRRKVEAYQRQAEGGLFIDAVAADLAALLRARRAEIDALIAYADERAAVERLRDHPPVLCHADIHVGNVLITPDDRLYVIDWDTVILAPKERDLMFPGAGIDGSLAPQAAAQVDWFFAGYGPCALDRDLLAYYRCERVIQDIAAYCDQILPSTEGGADRVVGLGQLQSQFAPGSVVAIALASIPG